MERVQPVERKVSLNSCASACEKSQLWQAAIDVLGEQPVDLRLVAVELLRCLDGQHKTQNVNTIAVCGIWCFKQ